MAKGSGNIRGKSSDASKPYDVSNSLVRRMASRMTEYLPQPTSWLSRWMSPSDVPSTSDFVGHSLSSTITSRPPATSRAELNITDNVDHHAPAAKKPRTNRYNPSENHNFLRNDHYGAEDLSPIAVRGAAGGEPVAGPSSRDPRPELIASTPAVPAQQIAAKVNGDDCSETSESTSGCSSLVPQAQSSTRSLGGSRYGRSIPSGSMDMALDRRRPSFNTTTFHSPLRASMRARLGSSPFYSGRTMYGGSSQASDYARLVETSQSHQASLVRRVGPTVRPPPSQTSSLPLSSTAKRILDALEQFSTPMIDAKKMPVVGSKRKFDATGGVQRYAELNIPSTVDLLRVKRRERLQQSTLEARETATQTMPAPAPAASTAPSPVTAEYTIRNENTEQKKHTGKVKTKEKLEEEETVVEVKLPAAVLAVKNLPKIDIAIPPPPPAVSAPKQSSAGSKFVFSQPTIVTSVKLPVSVPTSTFKFSEPLGDITSPSVSVAENVVSSVSKTRTSDQVSSNFTKREEKKNTFIINADVTFKTSAESSSVRNGSDKNKVALEDKTVSTTQKWECSNCKNNNSSRLQVCKTCQANKKIDSSKNNVKASSSGFDNLFKKPVGSWECSTCLILNKGEATKCVACESAKPAAKEKISKIDEISDKKPGQATSEAKSGSLFGNLFKKPSGSWTCDTCMINNDADKVKCAACETPKPGAAVPKPDETKQSTSGFGDLFKKPSGSWSCDVCMVSNDADKVKCVACETPKPGASIPKATETPGPKFSFGIPSAVSTSTPKVDATFSFGIPKGDQGSATSNTTFSVSKTTSESAQTPTPTFSFGIPKSENNSSNVVTSTTSSIPTFQFGSSNVKTNAEDTKPLSAAPSTLSTFQFGSSNVKTNAEDAKPSSSATPSHIFGNLPKKSTPETKKSAESEKTTFSIPTLTSSSSVDIKAAAPVFGEGSGKPSSELAKAGNTPNLFSFGNSKPVQNDVGASSTSKPIQPTFSFGAKQEGFGSSLPSSTTNTLSSSSPSNVFKFGDTKTVSSGSGATSISSISTQASVMTPKPNSMFSFKSNTEKKRITFKETPAKETANATSISTPTTDPPTFGTFGTGTPNTNSTFGSTNTFGSSLVSKEQQSTPFATQTNTNTFGTPTSNASSSFTSFGQTNAFQTQENKPSKSVFTFGASAPQKESAPSGGFVFNPVGFTASQTQQNAPAQQLFGFGGASATAPAPAPSPAFNFEPKTFGSSTPAPMFNASNSAPPSVFGAATPQQVPTFGEQTAPAPVFNFGSQSAPQPQAPVFGQQQNVAAAPSQAPTFMFGAAPAAPAAPANPPAFDPNIKPTFNFTQGAAAPVFSAIPTVNSTGPTQPQRKIRKAVRRTNTSVRN